MSNPAVDRLALMQTFIRIVEAGSLSAAARQLDCQRKRDQLTAYSNSSDINETDSLGNTRTYTAVERQALIERTKQQVQFACEPPAATPDHAPKP